MHICCITGSLCCVQAYVVAEAAAVDHACCPQRVLEVWGKVQGCQLASAAAEHSAVQTLDG
jgi:hypothetical protein